MNVAKKKCVVLDGYALNPGDISWEPFLEYVDLAVYDQTEEKDVLQRIRDAQMVLVNDVHITREIMDRNPQLEYLGAFATGYNAIDVQAAKEKGIPVTNIPDYGTMAVAQMALALLLEITNRTGMQAERVRRGEWIDCYDRRFWKTPMEELCGMRMGIIGLGNIGTQTAKLAQAFGMETVAYSRTKKDVEGVTMLGLEELLRTSDVISLNCPYNEGTEGIISRENIQKMKDGVILINTARGKLVDEQALAEALISGKVAALGSDVLAQEPPVDKSPLMDAPNTIITPHVAWAPRKTRQRLFDIALENIVSFLDGYPKNMVY